MTPDAFARWQDEAIRSYAADKVRVGTWSEADAIERSTREYASLLPEGLATPGHELRSVVTADGEVVGMLWFGPSDELGTDVAYIWAIEIDAAHRGRGYGRAALLALEPLARSLGYSSIGLHVFGDNEVARDLYRSAGYVETDVSMRKPID